MIADLERFQGDRFPLGRLLATPGVLQTVPVVEVLQAVGRHARGDWGELCEADRAENDRSVDQPLRILSAYRSSDDVRFWIITEADRSATTVLLPDEY